MIQFLFYFVNAERQLIKKKKKKRKKKRHFPCFRFADLLFITILTMHSMYEFYFNLLNVFDILKQNIISANDGIAFAVVNKAIIDAHKKDYSYKRRA